MDRPEPVLEISLMGGFRLVYDGKQVSGLGMPRAQALLAYLLLRRDAPVARRQLASTFWPDTTESQSRTNLRHLVSTVRSALPHSHEYLIQDRHSLGWNSQASYTLDVDEFEHALNRAVSPVELYKASQGYNGDLLPICYDEWILPQRERLSRMYLDALDRLADLWQEDGNYSQAIRAIGLLLQREPLREEVYQRLMKLHLANGDRAGALHTYQDYVSILQRELGLKPSEVMRLAYEELLDQKPLPVESGAAVWPLVGREKEWQRLKTAWQAACAGKPSLVVVEGEAGIGKTRLAEELMDWVARQGLHIARAHCYRVEAGLAYAPVATWLGAAPLPRLAPTWLSEVSRLLPEVLVEHPEIPLPTPMREAWQRGRLHEALARALLGGSRPLLLMLDDAQWADRDSLEWLHYLLRYDSTAPLLALITLRGDETEPDHPLAALLSGLRHSRQLVEVVLGPLNASESAELAGHARGLALSVDQGQAIYREAEGNPLFIVEMAQAGIAKPPPRRAGLNDSSGANLPPTVHALISDRLALLTAPARRVAELAAVLGRQFSFQVLKEAAKTDEQSLVNSLDELWLRRILREQGSDDYDFSHDKIRQVLYDELSHARRRSLHRQVAGGLERLHAAFPDTAAGEIAGHYELAGEMGKALEGYQRAAREARRVYAHQTALTWLHRALALLPKVHDEPYRRQSTVTIYESQGDVFKTLGRRPEAVGAYEHARQALSAGESLAIAGLLRKQGNAWLEDRRYDVAQECIVRAQAVLENDPHQTDLDWQQEWLQARLAQMQLLYWTYQWEQMADLAGQIQPRMETFGSPIQQVDLYHHLAQMAFLRAGFLGSRESCSAARRGLQAARETADMNAILSMQFSYGFHLLWSGELEPAARELSQTLAATRELGNRLLQTQCLTYLTIVERRRGNFEQVAELARESLEAAQAIRRVDYIGAAQANQAWLAWRMGDLEGTNRLGQAALEAWNTDSHPYPLQGLGIWPLVAVRLTRGEVNEAVEPARRLLDPAQQRLPAEMAALLEQAFHSHDEADWEAARLSLSRALELAQELNYL